MHDANEEMLRILVAEDTAFQREVLKTRLETLGYRTTAVADGLAAVRAFERQKFDAVILDYQMPRLDGLEAALLMRRLEAGDPARGRTPILTLTANLETARVDRFYEAGIDRVLAKPIRIDELGEHLGAVLCFPPTLVRDAEESSTTMVRPAIFRAA